MTLTVGVEEEYQLVDAATRALSPVGPAVLASARPRLGETVHPELISSMIEASTPVCDSLDDVDGHLRRLRRSLDGLAAAEGGRLAAAGTHPFARWEAQRITDKDRYVELTEQYRQVARETLIFGCHVHVGVEDPDLSVVVLNHVRPWLPVLLALTTNSPFWAGVDSGYASYRTEVFRRWPTTGVPGPFPDRAAYDARVQALVATGVVEDASKLYWDVRPSTRYPTVEFRVGDVCSRVEEAVMLTGLVRALTATAIDRAAVPPPQVPHEVLEAATWRAARDGLGGALVSPVGGRPVPAAEAVALLVDHVRPALHEAGDWQRVTEEITRVLAEGTGAARQRRAAAGGSLVAVVDAVVADTNRV